MQEQRCTTPHTSESEGANPFPLLTAESAIKVNYMQLWIHWQLL